MPFRVEGGRAWGPGVYDMKAGLVILEYALKAIDALGLALPRPLVALWTSDEEIGSPTSRERIEIEARQAAFALVLEPPIAGGRLKTARKGVGGFTIEVEGKSAHAGVDPEKGINAIVELSHQVLKINDLNRPDLGTTLSVGRVEGGTTPNVVPDRASALVDVRASGREEAERVESALRGLAPVLFGAKIRVTGRFNRPPMERTARSADLFEQARAIGRGLGLELGEGSTGGGSDGNFTAGVGTPTLDGLGADGRGAHASDEQISVDSLVERAGLLAALLLQLPDPS